MSKATEIIGLVAIDRQRFGNTVDLVDFNAHTKYAGLYQEQRASPVRLSSSALKPSI